MRPDPIDRGITEYERQFRELLEHRPAGLNVVDEDGRLLFHNAWIRELPGYSEEELYFFDTRKFWYDPDQGTRIVASLHDNADQIRCAAIWRPNPASRSHC